MVNKVYNIFKTLGYPTQYQIRPSFDSKGVVISYHFFNETHAYYGDGDGKHFVKNLQIDIFHKTDIKDLDRRIIKLLKEIGFRFNETYESDETLSGVRLYHKVLRFNYLEREGNIT